MDIQKQKNKEIRQLEHKLESIENILLNIGIDRSSKVSVEVNNKLLAQYESIEKQISYIQFRKYEK